MGLHKRVYIRNIPAKSPTPKIGKKHNFRVIDMAVWPDPTHGTCSHGHFKILISGKSDMFERSFVFIVFFTIILDLVSWKCSYGPWDHFRFSAKSVIVLDFYKSDSTCFKNISFSRLLYIYIYIYIYIYLKAYASAADPFPSQTTIYTVTTTGVVVA